MAHYVFQRNNGFGDFDYIRSFETMEITDYPEYAAQVEDKYLAYIDMPYLNSLGFYAVGITSLALRILPALLFRPLTRGYRPLVAPRPPRAHIPGAVPPRMPRPPRVPRPPRAAAPRPVGPGPRPIAPAPGPAPRGAAPSPRPAAPGMRPPRGPAGGRRGPGGR